MDALSESRLLLFKTEALSEQQQDTWHRGGTELPCPRLSSWGGEESPGKTQQVSAHPYTLTSWLSPPLTQGSPHPASESCLTGSTLLLGASRAAHRGISNPDEFIDTHHSSAP